MARVADMAGHGRVIHQFAPLDVPHWVARFLDSWRPDVAALVESELWPNLIAACQHRQIALALVNGRLSDRSLAGWRRAHCLAAPHAVRFRLGDGPQHGRCRPPGTGRRIPD
ncbi:glycosyltransferase N-terminal domain-containing protein [Komagataeibacter rhaeticus]|nr:glycosyltransferase N-terminal domain-containing protein [Komagataeibacter rhaeticus]